MLTTCFVATLICTQAPSPMPNESGVEATRVTDSAEPGPELGGLDRNPQYLAYAAAQVGLSLVDALIIGGLILSPTGRGLLLASSIVAVAANGAVVAGIVTLAGATGNLDPLQIVIAVLAGAPGIALGIVSGWAFASVFHWDMPTSCNPSSCELIDQEQGIIPMPFPLQTYLGFAGATSAGLVSLLGVSLARGLLAVE